jgi:predicted lipoprotein with Yx(FWY)xxD motif
MKGARVSVLTAIAGLGLLGLTACGSDTTGSVSAPKPNQDAAAQPQGPRANLVAQDVSTLGVVLTGQEGKTLYRFDKDTAKPAVSNCYDACAKTWPPYLAEGKQLTFTGVDEKAIGTVTRKDGTKQVTINGWPMYTYAKDAAPGDFNGQGMGGTWFAATPEGKKAQGTAPAGSQAPQSPKQQTKAATPPASNTDSGGSGYDNGSGY